jgi:proprotein convertase subtilisin/kexin type 5
MSKPLQILPACTSCIEGLFAYNYKCLKDCPLTHFKDKSLFLCRECDPGCKTCYSYDSKSCLSCYSPYFLFESECLAECPDKTYRNSDIGECYPCHFSCQTCTGPGPSLCVQCPVTRESNFSSIISNQSQLTKVMTTYCVCKDSYFEANTTFCSSEKKISILI